MEENKNKIFQYNSALFLSIIALVAIALGVSYAWLQLTLEGTKTNVIKVGDLTLELNDEEGIAINGNDVVPELDEVGLAEDPYTFKLINKGTTESKYTIYLDNVDLEAEETQLPDDAIKFDLKKDGTTLIRTLLSYSKQDENRMLDTGIIKDGETLTFDLRLWIDQDATSATAAGKTFRGKIRVVADQITAPIPTPEECFTFKEDTGTISEYLCGPTVSDGDRAIPNTNNPLPYTITDVVIPDTIKGIPVTNIKLDSYIPRGTFVHTGLTSVVIPSSVKIIGGQVFEYNNLTEVIIPEGVEEIGDSAFSKNPLRNVVIASSVKKMNQFVFYADSLASVTIKGKRSTADFELYITQFLMYEPGWINETCRQHTVLHSLDEDHGDNTNPCIHWEP